MDRRFNEIRGVYLWADEERAPSAEYIGIIRAGVATIAAALAAAAPSDGPLTPRIMYDLGTRLALHGRWSGFAEVRDDGELQLTPFNAWAVRGVWTGITQEQDGRLPRNIRAPGAAVFHVELPARPIPPNASTVEMLTAIETAAVGEARRGMSGRAVLTLPIEERATTADDWTKIAEWLEGKYTGARGAGRVPIMPPGVLPATMGGDERERVPLREQAFEEVEAMLGLPGLLRPVDGAAAHAAWRIATVRTFGPLARLIEDEAALKLDRPYRLNRDAWFAASHSERARLIAARAGGIARLVGAGMTAQEAAGMVRGFDAD